MNLMLLLKEKIAELVFTEYNISDVEFVIEHPENEDFGDFATNVALVLSKKIKQSPMDIAKNLSYKLLEQKLTNGATTTSSEIFSEIIPVAPGFINFKIAEYWLINLLMTDITSSKNYGVVKKGGNKRIALEHSNVNPNKAVHIGHLRNACIGQFIERIYELQDFNVEVQYYANNAGVQVSTSMMGIEKIKDVSPTSYKKYDHYAWDVYAQMETKIAESPDLQQERLSILQKLDDPVSPESIRQRAIADKILVEQLKTFAELGFNYDVIIYESDILARKLWEVAFEMLKANPNVYFANEGISKGCWLVRMGETAELDETVEKDKIIVRSNGVPTYTGKDIAYHMWKFGLLGIDFNYAKLDLGTQDKDLWATTNLEKSDSAITFSKVDYVFDVIGVEQTYAIDVVKKSLEYLGYEINAQNMKHINYGFVFLSQDTARGLGIDVSDNKKSYAMSGRKGWGVKVDDLITKLDDKLLLDYGEFSNAGKVRNAAIKFQMLKLNTFQDLVFDLAEALDLKGFSGPYLQYAYVRANAVLTKAAPEDLKFVMSVEQQLEPREITLSKALMKFPAIIDKASNAFAPNILCEYLFEISKKFNSFYNDLPILKAEPAETRQLRLALCQSFTDILQKGLWTLGIETVEKM